MPNTGKPSPNCHLCRQRRVKCDLDRPQCQRCIKYGVACPGYRDDEDLRFQHSNSTTFEKRKRKKQVRHPDQHWDALQIIAFTPESTASPPSQGTSSRHSTPPLFRTIRQHWTEESVPLVLGCYSTIDFLPNLFKGVPQDHCLILAGQVFAQAYVINRFRPDTDYNELSASLGKALASVSAAITDPKYYTSDSTITAVWLLGNYEVLMGSLERRFFMAQKENPTSTSSSWYIHTNGLLSLLRARGDKQFYSRSGRQIFWVMHNIVQIQCETTNSPCPPDFERWSRIIESSLQPGEALLLRTGRFIASACSLLSRLVPIARDGDKAAACAQYEELLAECDKAELDMLEWIQSEPNDPVKTGPVRAYFWNAWRATRIKLHHMVILVSNIVEHAPDCPFQPEALRTRRQLCLEIITTTAEEVVHSLPKELGGSMPGLDPHAPAAYFEAIRLIWPLSHIYVIPTVPRNLRIIARDALHRIGRERGILTALKPRPGTVQFPPEALTGVPADDLVALPDLTPKVQTL